MVHGLGGGLGRGLGRGALQGRDDLDCSHAGGRVNRVPFPALLAAAAPGLRRLAAEVSTGRWRPSHRDLKSTRLNSSHSQISYAVFCLKKKEKKQTDAGCRRETQTTH